MENHSGASLSLSVKHRNTSLAHDELWVLDILHPARFIVSFGPASRKSVDI